MKTNLEDFILEEIKKGKLKLTDEEGKLFTEESYAKHKIESEIFTFPVDMYKLCEIKD